MNDPLVARLQESLTAAQHRFRTRRGLGAYVTPQIPPAVIDAFAEALVPILRQAARDAAAEVRDAEVAR
jgi:hypothetical protein